MILKMNLLSCQDPEVVFLVISGDIGLEKEEVVTIYQDKQQLA